MRPETRVDFFYWVAHCSETFALYLLRPLDSSVNCRTALRGETTKRPPLADVSPITSQQTSTQNLLKVLVKMIIIIISIMSATTLKVHSKRMVMILKRTGAIVIIAMHDNPADDNHDNSGDHDMLAEG